MEFSLEEEEDKWIWSQETKDEVEILQVLVLSIFQKKRWIVLRLE